MPFHTISALWCVVLCLASAGCSSLGFSTYPVAHFMTKQTEAVLAGSPQRPSVARELAKEPLPMHYLQPGDELLVEVINGDSEIRLPADQQVFADGSLDLGKYGRLVVASLTLEQAERRIHQRLAESLTEEFMVNVRMIQPIHRYYVVGEVNSPGAYSLTGYETVLDGILAAGGLTARASACDTLLARPTDPCSCRVTLPVCYRAITQLGDTTTNYQLKPGDRIFVGRQTFREEFFPCCSKKTCPRCCDRQQACCDPRIAARVTPEFRLIETDTVATIPIAAPIDASSGQLQGSEQWDASQSDALPDVSVKPWVDDRQPSTTELQIDQFDQFEPARQPEMQEKPDQDVQDGQLEFDLPAIPSASQS